MSFDAEAPLPGAPDPWTSSSMPQPRSGPPYAMTEMISAEPALAERVVRRLAADPAVHELAADLRATAEVCGPIVLTGCGTSEHAAMVGAALLDDALRAAGTADARVAAVQAFELVGRAAASGASPWRPVPWRVWHLSRSRRALGRHRGPSDASPSEARGSGLDRRARLMPPRRGAFRPVAAPLS